MIQNNNNNNNIDTNFENQNGTWLYFVSQKSSIIKFKKKNYDFHFNIHNKRICEKNDLSSCYIYEISLSIIPN